MKVALPCAILFFAATGGCGFDDSASLDKVADGGDGGDGEFFECAQWDTTLFDPCGLPMPSADPVVLEDGTWTWDTGDGWLRKGDDIIDVPSTLVSTDRGTVRIASVQGFEIAPSASVRVIGNHSLLIASRSDINLLGPLDASSGADGRGAGANPAACSMGGGGASGSDAVLSGSGGGGGGFGGQGSLGGNTGGIVDGGSAGTAVALAGIGGGCPGGDGGTAPLADAARGGAGGGAVVFSARLSIRIARAVDAGGSGGGGAQASGGGGGGSGGLIGVDAPRAVVTNAAVVTANGGGGGEGGSPLLSGGNGSDGVRADQAASGGDGSGSLAGDGGAGAHRSGASQPGLSHLADGGGGGGGGVGFLVDYRGNLEVDLAATTSPVQVTPE